MTVLNTGFVVLYATIVLVLVAMAALVYYFLFITVMIAWDGCEICQRMRQGKASKTDQGHSLSRT